MSAIVRVCFCLVLFACTDVGATLCDGSTDIRFAATSGGGGPLPSAYPFTNPNGHTFLLVDGQCQFYAENGYLHGIASGKLSAGEAEELMRDVHWDDLNSWSYDWNQDMSCPDAGFMGIAGGEGFAGCSCGCDSGSPSGLDDALSKSFAWAQRLAAAADPLDGPVSALALDSSEQSDVLTNVKGVMLSFEAWPLDREMSSVEDLIHPADDPALWMRTAKFAHFSEPADYAKLRELRGSFAQGAGINLGPSAGIPIKEGSTTFDLFIRDELPEAFAKRWDTLRAMLPGT